MRCMFCESEVMKGNHKFGLPISLPGRGVAHSKCATQDLISRRIFGNIELQNISSEDLYELRELVLTEINYREGKDENEDILF